MALTDEDRTEIAGLIEAGCGEMLNKSLAGVTDTLKKVTDACAAMNQRLDAQDQARRDTGDIKRRIDAVSSKLTAVEKDPGEPEELAADGTPLTLADVQLRADAVATLFGERAPWPMAGESVGMYRKRMARIFSRHSKDFADVDLSKLPPEAFRAAESVIYASADSVGKAPPQVPEGKLLMREKKEDGHIIRTFHGSSPSVWMNQFAGHTGLKATGMWRHDNLGRS